MAKIKPNGSVVTGTVKNDNIAFVASKAWNKALTVNASSGNDIINFKKSKYKNRLNGQNGNDTIYGGTNIDTINGGNGNDKLYGYNGNDVIYGGQGNDIIYGGNGNDRIYGQYGTNTIKGENGNDIITGGTGVDKIWGGNGNDTVYGGNGNDIIYGDAGNDMLQGNAGNDTITGGAGDDTIWGGAGDDTIYGIAGANAIYGEDGNDTIVGGTGNDTIYGDDGNDVIYGTAGTNTINGGNGNDTIVGGYGNDTIDGGAGNDIIYGTAGTNVINGGAGNDRIYSGTGTNTINGGDGADYFDVTNGTNTIIFDRVAPNYYNDDIIGTVYGFKGSDTLNITTTNGWGVSPMRIDSNTKDLYLGINGTGTSSIIINDYSNDNRDGWISINGGALMRMSELLASSGIHLFNDEANILSDLPSGSYYTFGGNDVLTNVGNSDTWGGTSVYAGDGNDTITNINDGNVYIYGEDGDDTISTGTFALTNGFLYGGAGDDTITANDANVSAHLFGDEGNDTLTGGWHMSGGDGNDIITAITGNTYSFSNNTTIDGGAGDDEIHVEDTHTQGVIFNYYIDDALGNDIHYDNMTGTRYFRFGYHQGDSVVWGGADFFDTIRYAKCGNDLIIKYQDRTSGEYRNSITVKDFITSENQSNLWYRDEHGGYYTVLSYIAAHGYSEIIGTDANENIIGTDNADVLKGMGGNDTLTGGLGDDTLFGGTGNNTYIYNDGDGLDTIITISDGDVLQFNDYNALDLDLVKSGTDLYITYNGNNIINLKDFLNPDTITKLQLKFADGTTKNIFEFINDKGHSAEFNTYFVDYNAGIGKYGTDADEVFVFGCDSITAGRGDDRLYTYGYTDDDFTGEHIIYAGDGNDIIYQRGGSFNIRFLNATFDDLTAEGNWWIDGSDLIIKYDGVNTLTIKDYWTYDNRANQFQALRYAEDPDPSNPTYSWYSFDYYFYKNSILGDNYSNTLTGTDDNDYIRGFNGNDVITGGKGEDVLISNGGTDTFIFNKGDGRDRVICSAGDIIKFNDVNASEIDIYRDYFIYLKYGESDMMRIKSIPGKIIFSGDVEYNIIYSETYEYTNINNAGNYIVVGNKNCQDLINVSNAGANCLISIHGADPDDYYEDNINVTAGTATILVKEQDTRTVVNASSDTTINFTDTTLSNVHFSLESAHGDLLQLNDYLLRLRYNSDASYLTFGQTDNGYNLTVTDNISFKDYTGTNKTMAELIGYQNGEGTVNLTGTAGDDLLVDSLVAYGKGGNDVIWGSQTAYGFDVGQKNTAAGSSVKIYNATTAYAQCETNEIVGNALVANTYHAYIDQNTHIYEATNNTSYNDVLNFTNTNNVNDTDGQLFDNLAAQQIHVIFNVSSTYDRDADGALYAFGDVSFVDNANLNLWKTGQNYNGVTITNNSVETIHTTDGYTLTNADIADLADTIAGWLTSGGRDYGSVNEVLETNNPELITALIAQFDTANWQNTNKITDFQSVRFSDLTFSYESSNLTIADGNIEKIIPFDINHSGPISPIDKILALNNSDVLTEYSILNDALILNNSPNILYNTITGTIYNDKILINGEVDFNLSVSGGNGHDTIINNTSMPLGSLLGGAGNDTIINDGTGYVTINGEDGDDIITNNGSVSGILGGIGADIIINNGTARGYGIYGICIDGEDGNDTIINNGTLSGTLLASDGDDIITNFGMIEGGVTGDAGDDVITNAEGATILGSLNGGMGTDTIINNGTVRYGIYGGDGTYETYLNDGVNTITNNGTTGYIYGSAGDDIITNNGLVIPNYFLIDEAGAIDGGAGDDIIEVSGTVSTIYTGEGNDMIKIHSGANIDDIQFRDNTDPNSTILNFVDTNWEDLSIVRVNIRDNGLSYDYDAAISYNGQTLIIKDYYCQGDRISKIVAKDCEGQISELNLADVHITSNGNNFRIFAADNNQPLTIYFDEGVTLYDSYRSNNVATYGAGTYGRQFYYTYTNEDNVNVTDFFEINNITSSPNIKFVYSDDSYQYLTTNVSNGVLIGSNSNDLIIDSEDNDNIRTGAGNDMIFGLYGADNIIIDGSGTKTIKITREDYLGNDTVIFNSKPDVLNVELEEGIAFSTEQIGNDLVITIDDEPVAPFNEERTLTLKDLYNNTNAPDIENVHIYNSNYHDFSIGDIITNWEVASYPPSFINWINSSCNTNIIGLWRIPSNETGIQKWLLENYDINHDEINNTVTYTFRAGDGIRTIYSDSGNNNIGGNENLMDIVKFETALPLSYSMSDNSKDLLIHYGDNDAIIVKDYFMLDSRNTTVQTSWHTVQTIINGTSEISINGTIVKTGTDVLGDGAGIDNDYIVSDENGSIILARSGNDTLIAGLSNDTLLGGMGDDTYVINSLASYDKVYDESGADDKINITGVNKNDLTIRMDIAVDNDGNIIETESKNMYITLTSDFGSANKGIIVKDQFVEGCSIETITTADNYTLTLNDINTLRANVASWLYTNGFESVQQIIDSNNPGDITALIAQFDTANWQ